MQALAWLGFVAGLWLLLLTGSSVIKTLLIPRNLGSAIGTAVARSVLAVYRFRTAKIEDVHRREKIFASGAPTYLFVLLVIWIACLYVAYALMLLPFSNHSAVFAMRLSGSSLFTLGFAARRDLAARPKRPPHREPRAPAVRESSSEEAAASPDTPLRMSG